MGNSDRLEMASQHSSPNAAPRPKLVSEKSYRLFPTANQQPQISPRTLSKRTLKRTGSLLKRRSASLDEPLRAHRVARQPFSRPEDAPVPRLQPAPSTRGRVAKPSTQEKDVSSYARHSRTRNDRLDPHDQQVRLYMPRVSEDGGHGRSSSAPDNMAVGERIKKLTGLSHVTNASLSNSTKGAPSHSGTWYNARDSTVPTPSRRESKKTNGAKPGPFTEKPLPPPPPKEAESRTYLDASAHQRSQSTPLSPGPRSQFYLAPRSDSATELTPLKTPSKMDPNRKSYFPLSADAQMRELMGMSPIEDGEDSSEPPMPPMPILVSKFQKSVGLPTITVNTDVKSTEINEISPTSNPTEPLSVSEDRQSLSRPEMHSPTLSQASSRMVPAALRINSPKRSASKSGVEGRPPAPKANENQLAVAIEDDIEMTMSTWAELTQQTTTLHARYATLREDRQFILGAMTHSLREQRPGPDYVNTILDQQMSLANCCSSMDICLAKLKAVARRKDALAKTLATHALLNTPTWGLAEQQSALKTSPKASAPATSNTSAPHPPRSSSTQAHDKAHDMAHMLESTRYQNPSATQKFQSRIDSESDTDESGAPRRMNLKGVKAARILGLNLDGTIAEELPRMSSIRRPTHTLQANLSTTSLDREQFSRTPIPTSNNSHNTLPAPVSAPMHHNQSDWRSIDSPTIQTVFHSTGDYVDASTSSSRASSPVDERGAETPDAAYAASTFDDPKSPGMQTVHVYFEANSLSASLRASTSLSEAGEDELLEYYGCYR
jgi:hypothetical protein